MSIVKNTSGGFLGDGYNKALFNVDSVYYYRPPSITNATGAADTLSLTLPNVIYDNDTIFIICTSQSNNIITPPSEYTALKSNANFGVYYKISDGTEGGTLVTFGPTLNARNIGAFILRGRGNRLFDKSSEIITSGNTVSTVPSILPQKHSLVFLASYTNGKSTDPSNNGGFTDVLIDLADNNNGNELYVWYKRSDGNSTGDVTVTWPTAISGNGSILFSV